MMIKKKKSKTRRITKVLLMVLSVIVLLTTGDISTFLGAGNNVVTQNVAYGKEYSRNSKSLGVVVKERSLWAVDMISGLNTSIDNAGDFKSPRISPDGANVAYTKDGTLYVSKILSGGKKGAIKVKDNPLSYSWKDKGTLMYSLDKGGLYGFNLRDKTTIVYIDSKENYKNMVYGKDGKIYSEKYYYYTKNGEQYMPSKGIVSYDILNKKETTVIEARDFNGEKNDFGLRPGIAKISKDGRYIYVWMKSNSASLNADGVGVGVYDIDKEKLVAFNSKEIVALAYNDNISISPIDGSLAVLNNGGARDMNVNKTLVQIDGVKGTWQEILPKSMISTSGVYGLEAKGITTMTPAFSPDGKGVLYSGAKAMKEGKQWEQQPHNIYSVDIENKKVQQITVGNNFDFAPYYIEGSNSIMFIRKISATELQMWKIENSKETSLVKGIKIDEDSWYYGHYELQGVMDVYNAHD